ncbi:MAG: 50S ribosomal protein L22 [Planctomycetota bacterium]
MRLQNEKLRKLAAERGVGVEQIAGAVSAQNGMKPAEAEKAVRNWLAGRDHPRCRQGDIQAMASALGSPVKDIARFTSQVRHHRGSPLKARLVADAIRGKAVSEALELLTFSTKRAATNIQKALTAAYAEAELADVDDARLFVSESRVDEGAHIKRFRPKDRGRAHPILKRTSHITISIEERN